jgi:hypothetical protein
MDFATNPTIPGRPVQIGSRGLVKIIRNMFSKFYPGFIPICGYMVSGVRIQLPGTSVLTPET